MILTVSDPSIAETDALLDAFLARTLRPGRILVEPDRERGHRLGVFPGPPAAIRSSSPAALRSSIAAATAPWRGDDRSIASEWLKGQERARKSA